MHDRWLPALGPGRRLHGTHRGWSEGKAFPTRLCSTVILEQGFGFLACSASIQATREHARLSRLHRNHLNGSERQNGLELKLPPLVLVVIVAALMRVAAYATPMLDSSLPAKYLWSWSLA